MERVLVPPGVGTLKEGDIRIVNLEPKFFLMYFHFIFPFLFFSLKLRVRS